MATEKELYDFMINLWNRGLITKSPSEMDYERIVFDIQRQQSETNVLERVRNETGFHLNFLTTMTVKKCLFRKSGEVEKRCMRCGYVIPLTDNDVKALEDVINSTGEVPKCLK
jgi:hypothetical protein